MQIPSATQSLVSASVSSQARANEPALTVEITPNENNTDTGDRSQNSVDVVVTTPNAQRSAEVTREQAVNRLETRLLRNVVGGGNTISPAQALLLSQADQLNTDGLEDIYNLRRQQALVSAYLGGSPNNSNSTPSIGLSPNQPAGPQQLYNNALDAYIKQTIFFSTVERSGFSAKA